MHEAFNKITATKISIWNGDVMGEDIGLCQDASIRVATDNTTWAIPPTGVGFFTEAAPATFFLNWAKKNPSLALYLALTGHVIKGKDALTWGLATHFVRAENIEDMK